MRYLVQIDPPRELVGKLRLFVDSLGGAVQKRRIDRPHITVMGLHVHPENEQRLLAAVKHISAQAAPFTMTTSSTDLFANDDGVTCDVLVLGLKSLDFQDLHVRVIEALADLINWEESYRYEGLTPDQQAAYRAYGCPFYGPLFNPHISIAAVSGIHPDGRFAGFRWQVSALSVLKREEKGWVRIAEFPLGKREIGRRG